MRETKQKIDPRNLHWKWNVKENQCWSDFEMPFRKKNNISCNEINLYRNFIHATISTIPDSDFSYVLNKYSAIISIAILRFTRFFSFFSRLLPSSSKIKYRRIFSWFFFSSHIFLYIPMFITRGKIRNWCCWFSLLCQTYSYKCQMINLDKITRSSRMWTFLKRRHNESIEKKSSWKSSEKWNLI